MFNFEEFENTTQEGVTTFFCFFCLFVSEKWEGKEFGEWVNLSFSHLQVAVVGLAGVIPWDKMKSFYEDDRRNWGKQQWNRLLRKKKLKENPNNFSICWEMIMRSNLMRSKFIFSWGWIHEIEFFVTFHEVKIPNNDSISWSALFSWDRNCLIIQKSIIRQIRSHDQFVSHKNDHEIKIQNKLYKFCKLHLWLIFSHLCIKSFNLMIVLAANKSTMRSKFPNNALFWILISWLKCQPLDWFY